MTQYAPIVPMLSYEDAPAAIGFLTAAFGFEAGEPWVMEDGRIGHCELSRDGVVQLTLASAYPEMGMQSPRALETRYSQLLVQVDDVDAHHDVAVEHGAVVSAPPATQGHGNRIYRAVDPEGHRWIFSQSVATAP